MFVGFATRLRRAPNAAVCQEDLFNASPPQFRPGAWGMAYNDSNRAHGGGHIGLPFVRSPSLVPDDRIPHRGAATPVLLGPDVTSRALADPTILVFDSGLGGLTVFREIALARPDARLV